MPRLSGLGLAVLGLSVPGLLAAVSGAGGTTPQSGDEAIAVIERQLDAFNRHDVDAMTANVAEEFAWFAVDPQRVALELSGRTQFRRSMLQYFDAFRDARAEIEESFAVGNFVTVKERAFWGRPGAERSQAALAVYEVGDGIIQRVWYYPASE